MTSMNVDRPRRSLSRSITGVFGPELAASLPALRRYALQLSRNATDADDLVQDCVVQALSKMDRFEPGSNLKAWLRAVLKNVFLDGLRKGRRRRDCLVSLSAQATSMASLPEQLARLDLQVADRALEALPVPQRDALIMVAIHDQSYQETARRAGVPVGTIRSRVSRARQSLAASVQGVVVQPRLEHPLLLAGGSPRAT